MHKYKLAVILDNGASRQYLDKSLPACWLHLSLFIMMMKDQKFVNYFIFTWNFRSTLILRFSWFPKYRDTKVTRKMSVAKLYNGAKTNWPSTLAPAVCEPDAQVIIILESKPRNKRETFIFCCLYLAFENKHDLFNEISKSKWCVAKCATSEIAKITA